MAATEVSKDLFGAPGVSDPYVFEPGLVGIKRRINFNVANTAAGTVYEFLPLPKGMVVTAVRVEEVTSGGKCAAGTVTMKICDASESSADKAVGSAVTVGGSTAACSVQNLATPVVITANSVVSVVTSVNETAGGVIVTIIGYLSDGESIEAVELELPTWRAGQTEEQFLANVSGGDPYNANRVGMPIYPVANDQ